jgi:hypothetical protein
MPRGVPKITFPDIGPFLPIFSDVDLAVQFIEDSRRPNLRPLALREPKDLIAIAEFFQNQESQMSESTPPFIPQGHTSTPSQSSSTKPADENKAPKLRLILTLRPRVECPSLDSTNWFMSSVVSLTLA